MNYSVPIQPALNAMQLHLLQMFSFQSEQKDLEELQSVLYNHYRAKVDAAAGTLWHDHNLSDAKIEEMLHSHDRTPYK
jgi:hypothetical protein